MKHILSALILTGVPLVAMEKQPACSTRAIEKEYAFTIDTYLSSNFIDRLITNVFNKNKLPFWDEEEAERNYKNQLHIRDLIECLQLDKFSVMVGSSRMALKKLMDAERFKSFLVNIVFQSCFDIASTDFYLLHEFFHNIKWKNLKKILSNQEYLDLYNISSALVPSSQSEGTVKILDISYSSRLNTLVRPFLGFDLGDFLNIPLLTTLLTASSQVKKDLHSGSIAACLNLTVFLRSSGVEEEAVQSLQKAFIGHVTLLHDLMTSNKTLDKQVFYFLEQYGQQRLESLNEFPQEHIKGSTSSEKSTHS